MSTAIKTITYHFTYIDKCNMCGVPVDDHKVLGKRMNRSQGLFPRNKIGITTSIQKCNSCQLIYANPLPVVNDLADHYGVVPDSYWKSTYFEINETYFSHQIRSYQAINGKINNKNALDIGAGIGKCIIALNKAGFDTYGIEPSIPFYERALNKMNISPQNLENCTLEGFKGKNDYFDFITFGAVLEHLYDPATSIQKALTLLKPGGLIQIEVPSSSWLTNTIYNFLYKIRGLDYVGNISPMHSPFHLYEFGLESFQKNGENSGYEVVKHRYMVCSTYLPKILDPIVKPFMRMTNRGMQLEVWLKKKG